MKTITTKIWGLDLLLGGGLKLVHRFDKESAVILVRGAPGTGKTLFAMQLATALSEGVNGDIAYACVELLPPELREQWASFSRGMPFFESPFPAQLPESAKNANSVFVGLLDLGDNGDEPKTLESTLKSFIVDLRGMGKAPSVLVVDSLSDGYGLGSKLERHTVDSICKLAVTQGLCLILIEETPDYAPSYWSFAVDTVFELSLEREGHNEYQRMLTIRKHRFGATDPGPHRMEINSPNGVDVLPRVSSYGTPMVRGQLFNIAPEQLWSGKESPWAIKEAAERGWPRFRESVVAIFGGETSPLRRALLKLGKDDDGEDLRIEFGDARGVGALLRCDAHTTGESFIAEIVHAFHSPKGRKFRRLIVGDFRALRNFLYGDDIFRAMSVLIQYLHYWEIPAILFESVDKSSPFPPSEEPRIVDLADISIALWPLTGEAGQKVLYGDVVDRHNHKGAISKTRIAGYSS